MTGISNAPADVERRARQLLLDLGRGSVLILPDADADGLSSAAIAWRAIERLGGRPSVLHLPRGQSPHSEAARSAIVAANPDLVLVLDMGSRAGSIAPGVPTVIVDHHVIDGQPDDAILVSGAALDEQTSTSAMAWRLFSEISPEPKDEWLMAVGLAGDLGTAATKGIGKFSRKTLSSAVALVNAANRSASRDIDAAFQALLDANGPGDIAELKVASARRLVQMRDEVTAEVARCSRVAPRIAGRFALLWFASKARVHPLVAVRWKGRLASSIVIAANLGYLPGRVNFSMRSGMKVNLIEVLRSFKFPAGEEVAHGHPQATGGSLLVDDALTLFEQMGFDAGALKLRSPSEPLVDASQHHTHA